jgi:hypothetical protein
MTDIIETLERLAPTDGWEDNWADVLRRVGEDARPSVTRRRRWGRLGRKRTLLLAFVAAAIIAPLTALSALNNWWSSAYLPPPAQKPIVVTRGLWSGQRWTLIAYPSHPTTNGYGLCWGITFSRNPGLAAVPPQGSISAAVMAVPGVDASVTCDSIVGIDHWRHLPGTVPTVQTDESEFLSAPVATSAKRHPAWIAGVVVPSATHVILRWTAKPGRRPYRLVSPREVVRVATFAAPVVDYRVRLFAAPLPKPITRRTRTASADTLASTITGTNRDGHVVACSSGSINLEGVSPLKSCEP